MPEGRRDKNPGRSLLSLLQEIRRRNGPQVTLIQGPQNLNFISPASKVRPLDKAENLTRQNGIEQPEILRFHLFLRKFTEKFSLIWEPWERLGHL